MTAKPRYKWLQTALPAAAPARARGVFSEDFQGFADSQQLAAQRQPFCTSRPGQEGRKGLIPAAPGITLLQLPS